jgi:hypothetical protein
MVQVQSDARRVRYSRGEVDCLIERQRAADRMRRRERVLAQRRTGGGYGALVHGLVEYLEGK